MGCSSKIPQPGKLISNRNLFLTVQEAGKSKIKVPTESLVRGHFLLSVLGVLTWQKGKGDFWGLSLIFLWCGAGRGRHTLWHVRILVPQPGVEPVPPAVEAQSLNHWTARQVPDSVIHIHFRTISRDINTAAKFIGIEAATVGVASSGLEFRMVLGRLIIRYTKNCSLKQHLSPTPFWTWLARERWGSSGLFTMRRVCLHFP